MIANGSHLRSQTGRKTSPVSETATEAAAERITTLVALHHIVALGTRAKSDVMVSATRIDEHADLQAIEHLDFPIPCRTIRCIERAGNEADYLVAAASEWSMRHWPHPWESCAECYELGNARASQHGLGPAWRIVEVLR